MVGTCLRTTGQRVPAAGEDERAEAGEEASRACDDALSVLTRDKWPDEWTHSPSCAPGRTPVAARPAVDDFKHGLEALDRGRSPAAWAQAQDGLAHALMLRAIRQKISASPSVSAEDWANVLGDLDMDDAAVAADLPVVESPDPERDLLDAAHAIEAAAELITAATTRSARRADGPAGGLQAAGRRPAQRRRCPALAGARGARGGRQDDGWSGVDFEHRRLRDLMRRAGGFVADEMADDTPRALIAAAVEHLDAGDHALTQDDRAGARRHYDAANDLLLDVDPVDVRDGDGFRGCVARAFSGVARLESLEEDFDAAAAAADCAVDWLRLSDAGDGDVAAQLYVAGRAFAAAGRWSEAADRLSQAVTLYETAEDPPPEEAVTQLRKDRDDAASRVQSLHLRLAAPAGTEADGADAIVAQSALLVALWRAETEEERRALLGKAVWRFGMDFQDALMKAGDRRADHLLMLVDFVQVLIEWLEGLPITGGADETSRRAVVARDALARDGATPGERMTRVAAATLLALPEEHSQRDVDLAAEALWSHLDQLPDDDTLGCLETLGTLLRHGLVDDSALSDCGQRLRTARPPASGGCLRGRIPSGMPDDRALGAS